MRFSVLSAEWANPIKKSAALKVTSPIFGVTGASFNCLAPPAHVPTMANAWGGVYGQYDLSYLAFKWDAITAGYGWVAHAMLLNPAYANDLVRFAVARSHVVSAAFNFPPSPALGPRLKWMFASIDKTERGYLAFLTGQAVASRLSKIVWNAPRIFHQHLFGPVLIGAGYVPPANNAGADYICQPSALPQNTFSALEAKGRLIHFDPENQQTHRDVLTKGLHQACNVGFLPAKSAVSVATFDATPGLLVGQFWDPDQSEATILPENFPIDLSARYFRALMGFLAPFPMQLSNEIVHWDCRVLGLNVSMHLERYSVLRGMVREELSEANFYNWLTQNESPEKFDTDAGAFRNSDGLFLSPITPDQGPSDDRRVNSSRGF